MREIKFRFWNHIVGRMSQPYTLEQLTNEAPLWTNIIPLQFTGLKDKNGVDIFEGDLVKWTNGTVIKEGGEMVKNEKIIEVVIEPGLYCSIQHFTHNNNIEVIGNIYQNPELI